MLLLFGLLVILLWVGIFLFFKKIIDKSMDKWGEEIRKIFQESVEKSIVSIQENTKKSVASIQESAERSVASLQESVERSVVYLEEAEAKLIPQLQTAKEKIEDTQKNLDQLIGELKIREIVNEDKALEYLNKALDIFNELGMKRDIEIVKNCIAKIKAKK